MKKYFSSSGVIGEKWPKQPCSETQPVLPQTLCRPLCPSHGHIATSMEIKPCARYVAMQFSRQTYDQGITALNPNSFQQAMVRSQATSTRLISIYQYVYIHTYIHIYTHIIPCLIKAVSWWYSQCWSNIHSLPNFDGRVLQSQYSHGISSYITTS